MKQVLVVGEGAWGTAIATLLADNGFTVLLWCHDPQVAQTIAEKRINQRYLPGITLSETIIPVTDLSVAQQVDFIFEATPVVYVRSVLEQLKPYVTKNHTWVLLCKGIEQGYLLLPSQILDDVMGYSTKNVILTGPSFARDLANCDTTAVVLASKDAQLAADLQSMLANNYFKPFLSDDVIGVQAAGALKNVVTLALGMLDGAGYSDNARAFLFTQALQEIKTMITTLGGVPETTYGLAGIGDLVLTSMGNKSRNREVGHRLGAGDLLSTILEQTGYTPEGINTVQSIHQLAAKYEITLPLCAQIYHIIFGDGKTEDIVTSLMAL